MKLDLLTNATVVDDAIRFVFQKSNEKCDNEKLKLTASSNEDNEESNEPDYDKNEDQAEEQKEETGGITVNQVF
jgi:hypothetical protein